MYRWNMNEVNKMISHYEEIMDLSENPTERQKAYETVCSLEELQDYYDTVLSPAKGKKSKGYYSISKGISTKEMVDNDLRTLRDYGIYCPIVRDFTSQFVYSEVIKVKGLSRHPINDNEIVRFTSEFYRQFGGELPEAYVELASHFHDRLQFMKGNSQYDYSGYTHAIIGTNLIYIDVGKANSIQDYISLIHESAHGITSILNQDIMWDWSKYGLIEVESIFFEMLGVDYVAQRTNLEDDASKFRLDTFRDYLYTADLLCAKMDMYSDLTSKQLKDKKIIKNYLQNEIGYNKISINDACTSCIRDYIHYIVSYLIAIELYMIYKVDNDAALKLLYKIIMLKNLSTSQYLEAVKKLGINPGENLRKYFEMIVPNNGGIIYGKKL